MTTEPGSLLPARERRPRTSWRGLLSRPPVRAAALVVAVFGFLAAWAFASPVGSSPDEDYHLASIWCSSGERESACQVSDDGSVVSIPAVLSQTRCFAFQPEMSASCQPADLIVDPANFEVTDRGNFGIYEGDYPPLFYAVMSAFVGPDIEQSVINMRLFNVALFTAMLSAVYVASTVRVRRALVATSAVVVVPLGAFLIASINPSGWAITSALTLLFSIFGFLRTDRRSSMVILGLTSVVSLAMGAGSRGDSAMYSVIAIGAGTLLALRSVRHIKVIWLRLILPVVLAVAAALTFLNIGSGAVSAPSEGTDRWGAVLLFLDVFHYIPGALGLYKLGWLDTALPSIVWVLITLVCAGVVFAGFASIGLQRLVVLGLVSASLLLIPTYIAATSWTPGAALQSRYIYPLLIVAVAVATLSTERKPFNLSTPQRWAVVCAVSVANAVAIYTNLRRYVTGVDVVQYRLTPGEWWWSDAFLSSEWVVVLGSITLFVALVLATKVLVLPSEAASPPLSASRGEAPSEPEPEPQADLNRPVVATGDRSKRLDESQGRTVRAGTTA